jgi:hypothetical protein
MTAGSRASSPSISQDGAPGGMQGLADLGEIAPEVLRETFGG